MTKDNKMHQKHTVEWQGEAEVWLEDGTYSRHGEMMELLEEGD
jgi:hypothetical protein